MRQVKRLIDQADRMVRDGEVSDAFLGRMGMGNAEFRRFVTAWQRELETAQPSDTAGPPPSISTVAGGVGPAAEIIRTGSGGSGRSTVSPAVARSAGPQGQVQGAEARVSPRLKPAVSAYFDSVGRLAAEGGVKDRAP
jgi:hypothetical protein